MGVTPTPPARPKPALRTPQQFRMLLPLFLCLVTSGGAQKQLEEESELLEGSESQNYGYGYGTKVDGPHGSSTVYVHGFGTDDSYQPVPAHHGDGGGHDAYSYGHIDPYLNAKHGYGFSNGYGYNQVHGYGGYHGGPHHGGHLGHHSGHHGHHGHHGYAGYGAPTPFVGSGFRYGFGHGYGHVGHSFAPL